MDEETWFIYFGRRYYNPALARWVTPDPIGFEGGPNLYAYVLNNPLTHFDLYGLFAASEGGSTTSFFSGLSSLSNSIGGLGSTLLNGLSSIGAGLKSAWQYMGSSIEGLGRHSLPIPQLQDTIRSIGMFMQGKSTSDWQSWRENKSTCSSLGRPEMDPLFTQLMAGGINTSKDDMEQRATKCSDNGGGFNIYHFYNSAHGTAADIGEWFLQRLGIYTRSVKRLAAECRKQIERMGGVDGGGFVYLPAHSQGGEIADNLPMYLTPQELKMIHVSTFGSPKQIEEGIFGSVRNYVSESDYMPRILSMFSNGKKTNTIILPSNAWSEHSWDCNTYQNAYHKDLNQTIEQFKASR